MVTVGLWIAAASLVALSLECLGAATLFFGLAVVMIRFA
jgi:hypothetical protein